MEYEYTKLTHLINTLPPDQAYLLAVAVELVGHHNADYYPCNEFEHIGATNLLCQYGILANFISLSMVRKWPRTKKNK